MMPGQSEDTLAHSQHLQPASCERYSQIQFKITAERCLPHLHAWRESVKASARMSRSRQETFNGAVWLLGKVTFAEPRAETSVKFHRRHLEIGVCVTLLGITTSKTCLALFTNTVNTVHFKISSKSIKGKLLLTSINLKYNSCMSHIKLWFNTREVLTFFCPWSKQSFYLSVNTESRS